EWLPPPDLDTGQHRTNGYHHPERYLLPPEDDDGP
ncbi:HNH endonuclease, partial [Mycolicibacterium sp. BiH015]|nr:HNH endonuclease [Mycolicibacterium sp. BiH015]